MLDKKRRTLSETITSVEDPIELSQKGQVVLTKSSVTETFVPTTIANPKVLSIVPLMEKFNKSASTFYAELNTALTPDSGYKLYSIAEAKTGGSYLTSTTLANTKLGHMFVGSDNKFYRCKLASATGSATIGGVLASPTLKNKHLEEVPYTNELKFIKLKDVTSATTLAFAFEVKGY